MDLNSVENFRIISGDQDGNIFELNGNNSIFEGDVGYSNIQTDVGATMNVVTGANPASPTDYSNAIIDLNVLISYIGVQTYTSYNDTDIGSISSLIAPLMPGAYLFNNPASLEATLYLSGNGIFVFYFMSTFTIDNSSLTNPINLADGATANNLFFYSPYNIIIGQINRNATLYGNFISDLNIIQTSNIYINGRFLSSTGNVTVSGVNFINPDINCFVEGTKIMLASGEYKPIEEITQYDEIAVFGKIGGTVENPRITLLSNRPHAENAVYLGHKRVQTTRYSRPISILPNTFGNGIPFETIEVSPNHLVIFRRTLIKIKHLLNLPGVLMTDYTDVTYYHIEMNDRSIICSNGVLVETFFDPHNEYKARFDTIFNEKSNPSDFL